MADQQRQRDPSVRSRPSRFLARGIAELLKPWDFFRRFRDHETASGQRRQGEKSTIRRVVGLSGFAQIQSPVTAIFIHYHPHEFVAPGFARLVQSAVSSGFRVMFVSTARPSRAVPRLGACPGLAYVHRDNHGYDFGALKDARDTLERHGLLVDGRYVVLNSSMLNIASAGFGSDLVLDQLASTDTEEDLLGITASYETSGYHIQTYFYSVSSNLFRSDECKRFLEKYQQGLIKTKLSPRNYAIQSGELRLSRVAMDAGYSVRAIFDDLCLPTRQCYAQIEDLRQSIIKLVPSLESLEWSALHSSTSNPGLHQFEWLPRLGLQSNPSQSCWSLLLYRRFYFLKREALELAQAQAHHAPSVAALLMPLLDACEVSLPPWSDMHMLPHLIHSSKTEDPKEFKHSKHRNKKSSV